MGNVLRVHVLQPEQDLLNEVGRLLLRERLLLRNEVEQFAATETVTVDVIFKIKPIECRRYIDSSRNYSQLQNEDDVLAFGLLVDLVEVDNVLVFHLGQDVDLFLDVLSGDAASRRHQPLLLDELGRILGARALLDDAVHCRELAAEK